MRMFAAVTSPINDTPAPRPRWKLLLILVVLPWAAVVALDKIPALDRFSFMVTVARMGAVFATLLYALTVVSLPMLLDDREVDFVTAMLTSIALVRENPVVMLGWGAFIAVLLFVGMLPGFLGLFVVLPLLGHATWHLYRRAVHWA